MFCSSTYIHVSLHKTCRSQPSEYFWLLLYTQRMVFPIYFGNTHHDIPYNVPRDHFSSNLSTGMSHSFTNDTFDTNNLAVIHSVILYFDILQVAKVSMSINDDTRKGPPSWITLKQFINLATGFGNNGYGLRDAQVLVLTHRTFCTSKFSAFWNSKAQKIERIACLDFGCIQGVIERIKTPFLDATSTEYHTL